MSSDIKKRLRAPWGGSPGNCKEAADAIEALEAEVARFINARKECDRKFQNKVQELLKEFDRAVAAEARAERLRAALESIDAVAVDFGYYEAAARTMKAIAREALEEDKQ